MILIIKSAYEMPSATKTLLDQGTCRGFTLKFVEDVLVFESKVLHSMTWWGLFRMNICLQQLWQLVAVTEAWRLGNFLSKRSCEELFPGKHV